MARIDGNGNGWCGKHNGGVGEWVPVERMHKTRPICKPCHNAAEAVRRVKYRDATNERQRRKYHADAAFRRRMLDRQIERHRERVREGERLTTYRLANAKTCLGIVIRLESPRAVVILRDGTLIAPYAKTAARIRKGKPRERPVVPGDIVYIRYVRREISKGLRAGRRFKKTVYRAHFAESLTLKQQPELDELFRRQVEYLHGGGDRFYASFQRTLCGLFRPTVQAEREIIGQARAIERGEITPRFRRPGDWR